MASEKRFKGTFEELFEKNCFFRIFFKFISTSSLYIYIYTPISVTDQKIFFWVDIDPNYRQTAKKIGVIVHNAKKMVILYSEAKSRKSPK